MMMRCCLHTRSSGPHHRSRVYRVFYVVMMCLGEYMSVNLFLYCNASSKLSSMYQLCTYWNICLPRKSSECASNPNLTIISKFLCAFSPASSSLHEQLKSCINASGSKPQNFMCFQTTKLIFVEFFTRDGL